MRVPAAGEDGKFVVFGAVDYASGQIVWQLGPRKDGSAFHLSQPPGGHVP
jgi:hypothetical protein